MLHLKMGDLLKFKEFEDQLRIEGVNCKGFGIIPKYVMLDPDLTIEAKAIYAYFCSFAGNGDTTFPGRDKILADLSINKETYYKYFHSLTVQGYIHVQQNKGERSVFAKNVYTLVSNPKKFEDRPKDAKHTLAYSRIRFSGLKSNGFGTIPKAVMIDPRLPIKAKSIYAYFCSFTGSGNSAFPHNDKILFHLGIAGKTYYKFYRLLTELNYITAVQRHIDGRLCVNDYYLNDTPNELNAVKKTVCAYVTQGGKKPDTAENAQGGKKPYTVENAQGGKKPYTVEDAQGGKIPYTLKQDTPKQDTLKPDTNINNPNKNKSIKINSLNQQLSKPVYPAEAEESEGESEAEDKLIFEIESEMLQLEKIPYCYNANNRQMTVAIRFLADWENLSHNGYADNLRQHVYNLFVEALVEMCCAKTPMTLKGSVVNYSRIIDKINQSTHWKHDCADISEFSEVAMENFQKAISEQHIKNPMQYMKACIWDALQTGSVGLYAELRRNGF